MHSPASFFVRPGRSWIRPGIRLALALLICVGAGFAVRELTLARQLDLLAQQSRHHLEFYRMSLESLLSRNESLPRVLAMEKRLRSLLDNPGDPKLQEAANRYLLEVKNGADINAAYLMDRKGLTLAASNYAAPGSYVGHNYGYRPYFQSAMQDRLGRFYGVGATTGEPGFFLAAPINQGDEALGTVVVKISLENFEAAMARNGDPLLLVDDNGVVFLASVPELKYHFLMPLAPGVVQQIGLSRQYDNQHLRPLGMDLRLQGGPQRLRADLPDRPGEAYLVQSVRSGPFVALNCGALPESVFESEIFGHETGAFTGADKRRIGKIEYASNGTLFLDEIESMPLALQVKLLRVLQERCVERLGSNVSIPVNCRIVAATKTDLKRLSDQGGFRADLYYRLNVVTIELPPLRQRLSDIAPLMTYFLSQASQRFNREAPAWDEQDLFRWQHHDWPGNVRELKAVAERLCLGVGDGLEGIETAAVSLSARMDNYERSQIREALRGTRGNVAAAAEHLHLPRKTLYDKLARHQIDPESFR